MKRSITAITVALGLALGANVIAKDTEKGEKVEKVKLKDLPESVQKTINDHTEGGKIKKVVKETADGQTYYEVTLSKNGNKEEFKVGLDGNYLGEEKGEKHEKDQDKNK